MIGNVLNIFMEHDLNILMIFGITEKLIILTHIVGYCYKYSPATGFVLHGHIHSAYVSIVSLNVI